MNYVNHKELDVILELEFLWNQYAHWAKMAINSITLNLPNRLDVVNRLLQNPQDFAVALKPYLGEKHSLKFASLLTLHLEHSIEMIKLLMTGEYDEVKRVEKLWYENADNIVMFLYSINSYYAIERWQKMFFSHLRYIQDLAITGLNEKFEENIEIYDSFELDVLEMADIMSYSIIKQFPEKLSL